MTEQELVERLRAYADDDHERLCEGRNYDCTCGYDERRDPLLAEAADAITRLVEERDEARGSHLVEEGSTQSDEYTELEAQLAEMREALRKIVSCYDRNWQHQREKLDDIVPMARRALEQSQ